MISFFQKKLLHPVSFWKLNLLVWIAFNSITLFIRYEAFHDLVSTFLIALFLVPIEFVLSLFLREIYRRWFLEGLLCLKTSLFVLLLSFAVAAIEAVFAVQFFQFYAGVSAHAHWGLAEAWLMRTIFMGIIYVEWSLGYFGIKAEVAVHQEGLLKLEAQNESQRLELQLLRNQLDPHFLFNSLNGIATEVVDHPQTALNMVHELADYFRYSLKHQHCMLTSLALEMEGVEAYLKIEKMRFGKNLQVTVTLDPASGKKKIPSFLLQPLVENAVKYGFASSLPPFLLSVTATVDGDNLLIQVCNTGAPLSGDPLDGMGHATIKRRLELHYPGRHHFTFEEHNGLACATLELKGEPCLE